MEPAHQKVPTQLYRKLCGSYTHDHQMKWNLLFYKKNIALCRHLSLVMDASGSTLIRNDSRLKNPISGLFLYNVLSRRGWNLSKCSTDVEMGRLRVLAEKGQNPRTTWMSYIGGSLTYERSCEKEADEFAIQNESSSCHLRPGPRLTMDERLRSGVWWAVYRGVQDPRGRNGQHNGVHKVGE